MTTPLIISAQDVRDYLDLNSPGTQSSYSDATIGSNIRSALYYLEHKTGRFLYDRPATTWVIPGATMIRAQVAIPGFRAFTSVTWGGSSLTVGFTAGTSASCWAIPDQLNTGEYVALQFRAWRADSDRPWWLADQRWWDKALDSPFYPGNWGGGYAWTSMPDDLVIVGDGGYAAGSEPRHRAARRQGAGRVLHDAPALDPRRRGNHPGWRHPQLLAPAIRGRGVPGRLEARR